MRNDVLTSSRSAVAAKLSITEALTEVNDLK